MKDSRLTSKMTRYYSFSRYVSFLRSGLFLSNAQSFDDPWEGHVFHSITAQPTNIDNLAAFVTDRKKYIYVSCWHASDHESYAMWRIYGKDDAVAIQTDGERLRDLLKKIHEVHKAKPLLLTPVEYCMPTDGRLPEINQENTFSISYEDPSSDRDTQWRNAMQQLLMYKPSAYKYEQEVRIIALDSQAPDFLQLSDNHEVKIGISVPVTVNEFVLGVIVAPWADSAFVEAVRSVSERFGLPPDKVRQSSLFMHPGRH